MFLFFLKIFPWVTRLSPVLVSIKGSWKIISLALSIAAMVGTYLYINSLTGQIERLESQAVIYQLVNEDNLDTIRTLEGANKSLAEAIRITDEVRDAAEEKARQRASQAASELSNTLSELEDLRNANPTCVQLSSIDVGAACPVVVRRMRESAADSQD